MGSRVQQPVGVQVARRILPRVAATVRPNPMSTDHRLSATAHELRLPLSHIKGFVSTLRRLDIEWDEGTKQEFLAEIEHETDRLDEMIDELMGGANARHRRPRHPQRAPAAPADLIAGGLDRVRGLLCGRSVDIYAPRDLPLIEVDAGAIERAIANLVHNSVKYAPADSHIRIGARVVRRTIELCVEDDGPGIPPEDREQIFAPSYRGPQAWSSGRPGDGLGLTICESIVKAHRGRIWADDGPSGGARFTIALPLTVHGPDQARQTPPPSEGSGPLPGGSAGAYSGLAAALGCATQHLTSRA
jgi:two-component system, OmpR family, sensor histidine kinase KdpD